MKIRENKNNRKLFSKRKKREFIYMPCRLRNKTGVKKETFLWVDWDSDQQNYGRYAVRVVTYRISSQDLFQMKYVSGELIKGLLAVE